MGKTRRRSLTGMLVVGLLLAAPAASRAQRPGGDVGHPTFMSPHAAPIAVGGGRVFVANTPADTVDVIDASTLAVVARVPVGIDPVGVAVRPDGREVWVANHVSDSVSVIDADPASPTHLQVVATVQDLGPAGRITRFDEPVGVAFASDAKAYVTLSSENRVAVVDVADREPVGSLAITAQDPRALAVRGDRLYVIPFESNNQTQISGCRGPIDGDLCTFDAQVHVVDNNNVLSLGIDVDIVRHPEVPDRDLFVFDTATDELVEVVDTVGTLLYGLAVDSAGRVFVAQTEARNDANGRAGTLKHGLAEMENRAFLNRITRVDCGGGACGAPEFIELEPSPPAHPEPGAALATPFAIEVSGDDSTLVVSAAGSDTVFTVDAASGAVLGRAEVGAVPRGIALESDGDGQPRRAWVLNAVANTVSLVDVGDPAAPRVTATVPLEDPTHPAVKRGRVAFNDADASTTGTFSCESCHPDGHTDQLVWVLATPICDQRGCTQIPPRSTMPVRGLRDTAPYHWDGIPGDPYGGNNTANIWGESPPNCRADDETTCTRDLVDRTLATTMCLVGGCPVNDEGKAGALTGAERDDLAAFLLAVPYPPAQRRAYDNVLTPSAVFGFEAFHIDGVPDGDDGRINVCGNCHRMPFWVSTNTPGTGMDAPTWRGAYDRWLILPQGRWNVIDLRGRRDRENGFPERSMWGATLSARQNFWNMVTEGSTGFSGSFARQVTLNAASAGAAQTDDLLDALELSAAEGGIVLQGEGVLIDGGHASSAGAPARAAAARAGSVSGPRPVPGSGSRATPVSGSRASPVALQFDGGVYREQGAGGAGARSFSRPELTTLAADGRFVGTFTGRLGPNVDVDHPQPALWSVGPIEAQRGPQEFPVLSSADNTMVLSGRHVRDGAHLYVDGRRVPGSVRCESGALPDCDGERLVVEVVAGPGVRFLQVQNPGGLFSNDFIFFGRGGDGRPPIIRPPGAAAPAAPATPGPGALGGREGAAGRGVAGLGGTAAGDPFGAGGDASRAANGVFTAADGTVFRAETVVTGLAAPASLDFAPDGRLFVAEQGGRVWVLRPGARRPGLALSVGRGPSRRAGAPARVRAGAGGLAGGGAAAGEGTRLLDLALDPAFPDNGLVYLLQAGERPGAAGGRLVRYREVGGTLAQAAVLLDDLPVGAAPPGGRLRFGPDGLLYAALGGAGEAGGARDLASYAGKMLRVRADGAAPAGNPFASPVYSLGHFGPGGFDWHPLTGALWAAEPGGAGPGEINRIEAGADYGGPAADAFRPPPGTRPSALSLSPSVAPAGASFYAGAAIAGFRNDLFVAALDGAHLLRIRFDPADPDRIAAAERLLDGRFGRLADVVTGPDGGLYVATSNRDGRGAPAPGDDRVVRLIAVY